MAKVLKLAAHRGSYDGICTSCAGQIDNGMTLTTAFPFYAGNTKMPAGSYRIIPMHVDEPHRHSDVTFHRYGDVEYLNRVWIVGQRYRRTAWTTARRVMGLVWQPILSTTSSPNLCRISHAT
jgi:hypothetical protein